MLDKRSWSIDIVTQLELLSKNKDKSIEPTEFKRLLAELYEKNQFERDFLIDALDFEYSESLMNELRSINKLLNLYGKKVRNASGDKVIICDSWPEVSDYIEKVAIQLKTELNTRL